MCRSKKLLSILKYEQVLKNLQAIPEEAEVQVGSNFSAISPFKKKRSPYVHNQMAKKKTTQNSCQDVENRVTHTLLLGMYNWTAIVENSLAASCKAKQALSREHNNCTLGHLSQINENYVHIKTCTQLSRVTFIPNSLKLGTIQMSLNRYRHTMKCHSAIKRNYLIDSQLGSMLRELC